MISKVKFYGNYNGGSFVLEEISYGASYTQDNHRFTLLGYVEESESRWNLRVCQERYDSKLDKVIEDNRIVFTGRNREEAENFGKNYFNSETFEG